MKPDTPSYPTITAPTVATGSDLYNQAQNFFTQNGYGDLLNAQSTALGNANNPNYYASFQPTSFEQALGQQQFQNIWPDEQAHIMDALSKSGMAYSPAAATTIGNAYGNLATNIGEYLNTQANNRATNAIQAGLGINPMNFLSPYADLGAQQSNQQGTFDIQAQLHNADANYANSVANYNQGLAKNGAIGTAVGGIGGFLLGGPQGALIGSSLGSSLLGGSQAGGGIGNSLLASQYLGGMNNQPFGGLFNSGSGKNGVSSNNYQDFAQSVYGGDVGSNMGGQVQSLPANPFQ